MRAQPMIAVRERVTSGPGASVQHAFQLSGRRFIASEPYTDRVPDVQKLPSGGNLTQVVVNLPGSNIWVQLSVDARDRVAREVIVSPGHLIQRSFSYPGG
jgi:copper transport protein